MNKLREMLAKFMYGRYGTDRLNMFLLIVLIVCAGLNLFVRNGYFSIVMSSWETLLIVLIYYRMFSRNIQKRYAENQKYLSLENKVKRFLAEPSIYRSRERISISIPVLSADKNPNPQRKRKNQCPLSEMRGRICEKS